MGQIMRARNIYATLAAGSNFSDLLTGGGRGGAETAVATSAGREQLTGDRHRVSKPTNAGTDGGLSKGQRKRARDKGRKRRMQESQEEFRRRLAALLGRNIVPDEMQAELAELQAGLVGPAAASNPNNGAGSQP